MNIVYLKGDAKEKFRHFESLAFLLPTNLGLPMHSPSALTEHVSLSLARFFLLDPAMYLET